MPGRAVSRVCGLLQEGQDALERGDSLHAELCFSHALGLTEDLDDLSARRDAYSASGVSLVRSPFANLAVQAAREALGLDWQLGKAAGFLIGDMLSYGSALAHLNRHSEAFPRRTGLATLLYMSSRHFPSALLAH